ncbi:hypothetical protein BC830DRAFT_1111016 [Chytriomyces sp. MP71]|nr:hypothetical protein BC830DRAFT_1111016 [Chytriomyces sp. MP71]
MSLLLPAIDTTLVHHHERTDSGVTLASSGDQLGQLLSSLSSLNETNYRSPSNSNSASVSASADETPFGGVRRARSVASDVSAALSPRFAHAALAGDASSPVATHATATLEGLLESRSVMSDHLFKRNGHMDSDIWKLRFFVLADDARLYLFKNNVNPAATPLTFLPISTCSGSFDVDSDAYCLHLTGDGLSEDFSTIVKRTWILRCRDQASLSQWVNSIQSLLGQSPYTRLARSASLARSSISSNSVSGGASTDTSGYVALARSLSKGRPPLLSRSNSIASDAWGAARSVSSERSNAARAMHAAYLNMQKADMERIRAEAAFRREEEESVRVQIGELALQQDRVRLADEQARTEAERKEVLKVEKMKKKTQAKIAASFVNI